MIQSYEDKHHLQDQNGPFFLYKSFLVQTIVNCYYFHLPIGSFHCAKLKKILTVDPELWRCPIFGSKMVHLPQTNFFTENYYYHSHLPISLFHCAKLKKKIFQQIQSYEDVQFLGPNSPFPQMRISLENLVMSLVYFIHAYLHAKNQSQILIY